MNPASELTISAAVEQFRVSRKTIRRRLADGSIEGARQRQGDHGPEWVFPAESLEKLGYERAEQKEPGGSDSAPAPSRGRNPARMVAGLLLLILGGAVLGFLLAGGISDDGDAEAESADPVWAVLADLTSDGDEVGVAGSGVTTGVPSGRIPIPVDDVAALADGPRYVVVGPDAPDDLVTSLQAASTPVLALDAAARGAWIFDMAASPAMAAPTTTTAPTTTVAPTTAPTTTVAPTTTAAPSTTAAPTTTTSAVPEAEPPVEAPPAAPDPAPTTPNVEGPPPAAVPDTITVADGDSFWSIAEDVVTASGNAPTVDAVTSYWASLVDANVDQLVDAGNPDLLLPGQVLTVPAL